MLKLVVEVLPISDRGKEALGPWINLKHGQQMPLWEEVRGPKKPAFSRIPATPVPNLPALFFGLEAVEHPAQRKSPVSGGKGQKTDTGKLDHPP